MKDVFHYEDFSGRGKSEDVGAYWLTSSLQINVCPYCNRQYIHTVRMEGKKTGTRAELDHFYAKSIDPFLAVSFANMVPSCSICNSRMKRDRDFYAVPHQHPYQAGFERVYAFRVAFEDDREEVWVKSWFEPNPKAFSLKLEPVPGGNEETAKRQIEHRDLLFARHV
ncbi:hypothetical protein [Tumebacillus permanentifrigoris]|uniref:HNH endonuclease n=1 Tax=Tumebacillus permanentifrigoris TaxID=378543 RepID=A0A316D3K3_9BACL|nr:hypothetical protein [Tumebacillus permanentifrigoris]PWK03930.1 hypothetical protein C7459_14318 [Tumebacillus permanentifrigoris]